MKKNEKIVLLVAVLFAILLYFGVNAYRENQNDVVVYNAAGKELLKFSLETDKTYTLQGDYGEFNLEVKDGKVHAVNVDCPNHDCEAMGYLYPGSLTTAIICIPNAIYVELINNESD